MRRTPRTSWITRLRQPTRVALAASCLLIAAAGTGWSAVRYVDADAVGANDGSSWADAYVDLQSALGSAVSGDSIWVAEGTYHPTSSTDRSVSFVLVNDVALFGGFDGTETILSQRDFLTNVTTLSGDIGAPADSTDNSFHVVFVPTGIDTVLTRLDGFTITEGNADSTNTSGGGINLQAFAGARFANLVVSANAAEIDGGGIYASVGASIYDNVSFIGNVAGVRGGGFYTLGDDVIRDATFTGNVSGQNGGGLYSFSGAPTLSRVTFDSNVASSAGGFYLNNGPTTQTDLVFVDNTATSNGGAMWVNTSTHTFFGLECRNNGANAGGGLYSTSADITISGALLVGNDASTGGALRVASSSGSLDVVNATITGNTATLTAGGIYCAGALTYTNVISYANSAPTDPEIRYVSLGDGTISNSLIAGSGGSGSWDSDFGTDGGGNVDADALFLDAGSDDYRLHVTSPALDAGDSTAVGLPATDLDGNDRITGLEVDMGAYEHQPACVGSRLYVDLDATGNGDGSSWIDAHTDLQTALYDAGLCGGVSEIWVAEGNYYPTPGLDREATFFLQDIGVFGGFDGTETMLEQRDFVANVTVLNGDIGVPADSTDNANNIVILPFEADSSSTILDGFTVTEGNATGPPLVVGGGIAIYNLGSGTFRNLIITNNTASAAGGGASIGAGVSVFENVVISNNVAGSAGGVSSSGKTRFTDVIFSNNVANGLGGGMQANGQPLLTRVTFDGNHSLASHGGGLHMGPSSQVLVDVTFRNNTASGDGGGLYLNNVGATFLNVTFENNSAPEGGGVYCFGASINTTFLNALFRGNTATNGGGLYGGPLNGPKIVNATFHDNTATSFGGAIYHSAGLSLTNSILWGNTAPTGPQIHEVTGGAGVIAYSLIEGSGGSGGSWDPSLGSDGGNNLDTDPLFVDAPGGNLRLSLASPALDAGSDAVPELPAIDLDGLLRVQGPTVDMGPYELGSPPAILSIVDIGNDQGRHARLTFTASPFDVAGSPMPVVRYDAFRRIDPLPGERIQGWEQVASVNAFGESSYSMVVPTLADSTESEGLHLSTFFVRASTATPALFYDSAPDSGYTLDNLAPGIPGNFRFVASSILAWEESVDVDFDFFTVYGGASADFSTASVVGFTTGLTFDVIGESHAYYFVTATDFSGNEGREASIDTTTGVSPSSVIPVVAAVRAFPNPFNPAATVRYDVPTASRVTVTVHDASGRLVERLVDDVAMAPGAYEIRYRPTMASGVYFVKLEVGSEVKSHKITLLK